jgi:hypothetical protein
MLTRYDVSEVQCIPSSINSPHHSGKSFIFNSTISIRDWNPPQVKVRMITAETTSRVGIRDEIRSLVKIPLNQGLHNCRKPCRLGDSIFRGVS